MAVNICSVANRWFQDTRTAVRWPFSKGSSIVIKSLSASSCPLKSLHSGSLFQRSICPQPSTKRKAFVAIFSFMRMPVPCKRGHAEVEEGEVYCSGQLGDEIGNVASKEINVVRETTEMDISACQRRFLWIAIERVDATTTAPCRMR